MKKQDWALFFLGSLFLLSGAVWGLTRPAIWGDTNFTDIGGIGDAIGGISSPIIELVGAVLIYFSFKQQLEANRLQFESYNEQKEQGDKVNNYERLMDLYKELKEDVEKLKYLKFSSLDKEIYHGPDALENFANDAKNSGEEVFQSNTITMNEVLYVTSSLYFLIFKTSELHDKLNTTDKNIILQKVVFIYHARFDENLAVLINYSYHSKQQKYKNWGIALNDMNNGIRTLFKAMNVAF